jgi:ribokinase
MPQRSLIYVVGSSNTDMVIQSDKLPYPGETVIGGEFLMNPGGKGANQAVAAARLGGTVFFVGKTGDDLFGKQAVQQLKKENIHTDFLATDPHRPSGVALICVDKSGENSISVAPGANAALTKEDISVALGQLTKNDLVLVQLEIPLEVVSYAVAKSAAVGARVILNPAPAQTLADETLSSLFLITPNEIEAEHLTGIRVSDLQSAENAARVLRERGCEHVLITLGAKGAYVYSGEISTIVPSVPIKAVDTTAAGDCFNGALAVALSEGMNIREAVTFACKSAAISATRMGAQASMPYRVEVETD